MEKKRYSKYILNIENKDKGKESVRFNSSVFRFRKHSVIKITTPLLNTNLYLIKSLLVKSIVIFVFVLFSLLTVGNIFAPKPQISKDQIIKDFTLKQTSSIVANSQSVKWSIIVKKSDINNNQYLIELPKTAKNIKVKTITSQEAQALLSKSLPQVSVQLTNNDRKKLAKSLNANPYFSIANFTASFFPRISSLFLASVEGAVDQTVEITDQDVIKTDEAKLVDLSSQVSDQQQDSPTDSSQAEQQPVDQDQITQEQSPTVPETPSLGEAPSMDVSQTISSSDSSVIPEQDQQLEEALKELPKEEFVEVKFETPPPVVTEQETPEGKQVIVSDPSTDPNQPQLTNVLAFTTIPEIFKVGQEDKIQVKWQNNNNQDVEFKAYDLNNNGKLDYIEWTVPHLSEQIFNIIFISKAFKLDQDRNIIEDIYDTVRTKDQNYATIETNQYVRVTFEKILTNANDITLYAKATNSGQPAKVEVYTENGTNLIATFEDINQENTYRILLTNLQVPTDTFDLKITSNNADIDYVVDPTVLYWVGSAGGNFSTAANWNTAAAACSGAGNASAAPGTGDTATFTSNCTNNAAIDANLSIATVTINSGYTGTITQNNSITITIATAWTQADGTFTGGNSSFTTNYSMPLTISGGTFNATSGTTYLGGDFTISGGTFNAGTGTVEANNNAAPIWDFASAVTFNNFTLNKTSDDGNLYIGSDDAADVNTWNVNGTLTLGEGKISPQNHHSGFALNAKGPISVLATHDGGGGGTTPAQTSNDYDDSILNINGTGDQSFAIPAGAKMMATTLNNSLTTVSTSGSGTITWRRRLTVTAGTFTAGSVNHVLYGGLTVNGGTFTGGSGTVSVTNDVTLSSGTLTAPSSTLSLSFPSISLVSNSLKSPYGWTHTAGGTFTHNSGTVEFNGDPNTTTTVDLAAISTSGAFNNLTVNLTGNTTLTIASGDTLTANGTFTWTDGNIDTGTVDAKSTVVVDATADGKTTTASILQLSGTSTQTCTLNGGGEVSKLTINNASATCTVAGTGTFTFTDLFTLTSGAFNGGSITNDFNGATISITISSGTFTATSGTMTVARGWTHTAGGTFNHNDGTVVLDGGSPTTIDVATSETFKNLTIERTSDVSAITISSGDTLIVTGTLSLTNGVVNTGTLEAQGAVTISSTFDSSSASLTFTGTANQTFTDSGTGSKPTGTWTINKSSGTVTLATAMVVNATGQDLTITSGTLDLAGFNLTVNDVFTLGASGTLKLQGGETVSTIDTITAGSTVNYNGTTSYTGLAVGNSYSNLTFSGSGGTWTLNNNLTVSSALIVSAGTLNASGFTNTVTGLATVSGGTYTASTATQTFDGGLTVSGGTFTGSTGSVDVNGVLTVSSGTFTAPGSTGTFTVSGNFAHSGGTFTHNSGTATLDGNDQTITCSSSGTTFNNLTKTVATARTLTFTASVTCTVSGTWTAQGASGALLSLRSSSDGTQWKIDPQGTRTVSFLDVKDSNNTGSTAISCLTGTNNCTNSGNNTNWTFAVESTSSSAGPRPPSGIGEYIEATGEIPGKMAEIPEAIIEGAKKIAEQVSKIQKQLADLIRSKKEKSTEIVTVPEETPFVFGETKELLPLDPIKKFVLAPLPKELQFFTERFRGLEDTLKEVGILKISDIVKLEGASVNLPGLLELASLSNKEIPTTELSFSEKQKVPTEIVFARMGNGLIDLNINLSVNQKGEPEQKIETISGKSLELVIKPDKQVNKIKGYLVLRKRGATTGFLEEFLGRATASLAGSVSNTGQQQEKKAGVEQKLVLQEFEYTDPDKDGIYTANIQTPVVDGEYEVITVMDYEDPKLPLREFQLIVVVDPEGYIYEQLPQGQLRIKNAKAHLYWLNPETNNYELWPAEKYLQDNPYITDDTGRYSFLVPKGEYYLKVVAAGYVDYQSEKFSVTKGDGVHMDTKMTRKSWWGALMDWFKNLTGLTGKK